MSDFKKLTISDSLIDKIYKEKTIKLTSIPDPEINSYYTLRSDIQTKKTAIARLMSANDYQAIFKLVNSNIQGFNGIQAKDIKQASFIESLSDPNILVSVCTGTAGTGKTTLAIAYAAQEYLLNKKAIKLTKPTTFIGSGNAFGPVPGDIQEKYAPYLESYQIVLKKIFGDKDHYISQMMKKGDLSFIPLALARGCTYDSSVFLIDEAQNLSWHELNSIVSRMGENTKLIIMGDLKQIDIKTKIKDTGLYQFINSKAFKESPITSSVELTTQYRSPITKLVADVHEELLLKNQ